MRAIAKELGRPLTTVFNTVKRFKLTGSHLSKEGRGRKTKLTARDHAYIRKISMRDRRKTVPVITEEFNSGRKDKVSASCVRRSLIKSDMRARVAAKKPFLRKPNVKKRLAFALKHVRWSKKKWSKVLFTDESKFELFGNNRRIYVRRGAGERFRSYCLLPTMKHGGGSIMVWGGISANGVTPLKRIEGIMDKKVYHNIIVRQAMPAGKRLIGKGFIYQEDNDPKHASKLCRNYLQKKEDKGSCSCIINQSTGLIFKRVYFNHMIGEVIRMIWPPQSPDLNPIEQIWELLDRQLQKSAKTSATNIWNNLQTAWNSISKETLRKYIFSMRRRCQAVINAKGGHTKY